MRGLLFLFVMLLPTCLWAAEADLVLINGRIYTQNSDQPWVESVAAVNGRLIYLGSSRGAAGLIGDSTQVFDLQGKMAMPGLVDGHVHPVLGGMEAATQCLFPTGSGPGEIAEVLSACIEERPDALWIVGGRWDSSFFREHNLGSPVKWLDAISTEKAISLADDTGHNRWTNSLALQLSGIDAASRIEGGEVVLDGSGIPYGLLLEAAIWPLLKRIEKDLAFTPADYRRAAKLALADASRYGFTGIKEAGDADQGIYAYKALDDSGELNVHLSACIAATFSADWRLETQRLLRIRDENRGININPNCAKLFLDGVPSEARTAAMIEDYLPEEQGGEADKGKLLIPPGTMKKAVAELDALGFTVKAHVAGDRAVREFLDAIAYARKVNGDSGLRHEAGHSGLIHPSDIARFASLNAVADMSPSIWYPAPVMDSIVAALGERGKHYWPFKDLLDAGALVIAGSDWPAVVPNMDPWTGLESMVTRKHPKGAYPGVHWPEQALSLEQAIRINTLNGAEVLGLANESGSLERGKYADLIVLNQNLFEIPAREISETKVEKTFFKGKLVYQRAR